MQCRRALGCAAVCGVTFGRQDGDKEELGLAEVERGMALYRKIKHGIVKPDPPPNIVVDGVKCGKQLVHVVEEEATLITVAQRLNVEVKPH